MKKILTLAAIAIIFATSFTNGSTVKDTKSVLATPKTHKNTKSYTKISVKEFSIKRMQDIK